MLLPIFAFTLPKRLVVISLLPDVSSAKARKTKIDKLRLARFAMANAMMKEDEEKEARRAAWETGNITQIA